MSPPQNSDVANATAEFSWERVECFLDYLDEMFTLHPSLQWKKKGRLTPNNLRQIRPQSIAANSANLFLMLVSPRCGLRESPLRPLLRRWVALTSIIPTTRITRFAISCTNCASVGTGDENGQIVKLPYHVDKSTRKAAQRAGLRAWA